MLGNPASSYRDKNVQVPAGFQLLTGEVPRLWESQVSLNNRSMHLELAAGHAPVCCWLSLSTVAHFCCGAA
jgi:hypothetical protein